MNTFNAQPQRKSEPTEEDRKHLDKVVALLNKSFKLPRDISSTNPAPAHTKDSIIKLYKLVSGLDVDFPEGKTRWGCDLDWKQICATYEKIARVKENLLQPSSGDFERLVGRFI